MLHCHKQPFLRSVIGPTVLHKILINEFGECVLSFMESLIAGFIQFSSAIPNFFIYGREIGH